MARWGQYCYLPGHASFRISPDYAALHIETMCTSNTQPARTESSGHILVGHSLLGLRNQDRFHVCSLDAVALQRSEHTYLCSDVKQSSNTLSFVLL